MKNIAEFKRAMIPGSVWETKLYYETSKGEYTLQKHWPERKCTISNTVSFALETEKNGKHCNSFCDWPKKEDFDYMGDKTVIINFSMGNGSGKLEYTLL